MADVVVAQHGSAAQSFVASRAWPCFPRALASGTMRRSMSDAFANTDSNRFRWTALAVAAGTLAGIVAYLLEDDPRGFAALAGTTTLMFVSKLAIFGGMSDKNPFSPWELGLIACVLDIWVSCALLAGIASFELLPLAGRALGEAHDRAGAKLRQYPGLRRWALLGVAMLVFMPVPGSGAVVGTLAGRLIGLSRMATLAAVAVGSGAAIASYASLATLLGEKWQSLVNNPWIVLASICALVVFGWIAWLRVKKELQRS